MTLLVVAIMNDWGMGHINTDRPDTIKIPQLYLVCWVLICRAILMEVSPSSLPPCVHCHLQPNLVHHHLLLCPKESMAIGFECRYRS